MDETTLTQELLTFFKALADANRLKIVGLLATQPMSVEQLAHVLNLGASTVSHHLARLSEAGLVSARPESYYNVYRLEADALEKMARRLLSSETLPAVAADVDTDSYDRKVVANFSDPGGRIKALPAQQKKLLAVLRHVARSFEPGVRYPEKQVNEILKQFSDDTATLRRLLVDFRFLARQGGGGEYWLAEAAEMERQGSPK